jgi:hypothetical protein
MKISLAKLRIESSVFGNIISEKWVFLEIAFPISG